MVSEERLNISMKSGLKKKPLKGYTGRHFRLDRKYVYVFKVVIYS